MEVNDIDIHCEIMEDIKRLEVKCPACEGYCGDAQYTCSVCWCEGGDGIINVFDYIKNNSE